MSELSDTLFEQGCALNRVAAETYGATMKLIGPKAHELCGSEFCSICYPEFQPVTTTVESPTARDAVTDMLMSISLREWLDLKAARDLLLAACKASEREYDEESTHGDGRCPDCTLGCIPIAKPQFCAHHLRVAAIAKAEKS